MSINPDSGTTVKARPEEQETSTRRTKQKGRDNRKRKYQRPKKLRPESDSNRSEPTPEEGRTNDVGVYDREF